MGDTYAGGSIRCSVNPAPDGFKGSDWDNREKTDHSCASGRVALGEVSATKIPSEQHPYEIGGRGLLGDMACYMGSGGKQSQFWTTQDSYDHLFNQLDPASTPKIRFRTTPERLISYFGYMKEDGTIEIDPWESYEDTVQVTDSTGDVMIKALDADGKVVASTKLDIQFYVLSTPPEPITKVEWAPFEGTMKFPEGTRKFQITKSGKMLKEIAVSANKPVVNNVLPATAMKIDGEYKLTWSASDDDGDTLTYTVEYNRDVTNPESEWMVLIADLESPEWDENFSELPGGEHAKIRITATDGILAAQAESAEFTVPNKTPEAFIYDDEDESGSNNSFEQGAEVFLEGEAFDVEDDWLSDNKLIWSSNISGKIGEGSILVVDTLPVGDHTISLTATDSNGQTSVKTTKIKITLNSVITPNIGDRVSLDDTLSIVIPNINYEGEALNMALSLELSDPSNFIWKLKGTTPSTTQMASPITISKDFKILFSEINYKNNTISLPITLEPMFNKADPFALYWKLAL